MNNAVPPVTFDSFVRLFSSIHNIAPHAFIIQHAFVSAYHVMYLPEGLICPWQSELAPFLPAPLSAHLHNRIQFLCMTLQRT
jgi:hypothetical protein